jgi:hypothetical protein
VDPFDNAFRLVKWPRRRDFAIRKPQNGANQTLPPVRIAYAGVLALILQTNAELSACHTPFCGQHLLDTPP